MASRYGRPVYLVGSAHRETMPRDIDIRIVLSCKEFESRFGDWKEWRMWIAIPSRADQMRRWHVEMAKMNRQGCDHTHLPLDFQVYPMVEAIGYMNLPRHRLDDIPGIVPPWQD